MASLHEYISSAVVNGELPADFSLPDTGDRGAVKWADGAMDGVTVYHTHIPELSKDDHTLMSDAVRAAGQGDYDLADSLFKMLGSRLRAITVIDEMQNFIMENHSKLNPTKLFHYASRLLYESDDRECVKFGLSLLELLRTDNNDKLRDAVRTIGLSDEFTLFAVFVMLRWADGNNEVWELAKKVHGWGRIHAVERLEPDTEEIRRWILREGVHNNVMPAYSALTCWHKSGAEEILRGDPTKEEFSAIGDIITGLLDEGPVAGISAIGNYDEILSVFLDDARNMELTLEDCEVIYGILEYYRETVSDKCPIAVQCRTLLHTYHARCLIIDAVKQGKCLEMAAGTGVDITKYTTE